MRDRSNSREKAETVRKRGFGLSRPVLCIAVSLTLVIGCIPHDDPISSAKAEALVPVAVGVGAAAATAMGITETELILGIMAVLGAGVGMQVSFNDMYNSLDASTGEIDLESYNTNYVDWKSKGIDLPSWGDLDANARSQWGWAWKYDEAIWLAYWMKFVGLNPNGDPNNPNNSPNDNKKWNLVKVLGTTAGGTAAAELGLWGATNFLQVWDVDSIGVFGVNEAMLNGHVCPFVTFQGQARISDSDVRGITYNSWYIGCKQYVYNGNEVNLARFAIMELPMANWENYALNYKIKETTSGNETYWVYQGANPPNSSGWGTPEYNFDTGTWRSVSGGVLIPASNYRLGHNIIQQSGNLWQDNYYFLNPMWIGGYTFTDSAGVTIQPTVENDYQYGQYSDYPQEQAGHLLNDEPSDWNQYWQNMQASDPNKTVTVVNPYYQGNMNPSWEDYFSEQTTTNVNPVPDTTPDTEPLPDSGSGDDTDPDYDDRLRGIAELAFSQAFPFCLINDIKLLSDKFVEAGSANPDFSVDIPLEDFGIEGVEVLTLDANHPSTGGGLLELGDYTRPLITIVFIGILLGFSIKLFLR